MMTLNKNSMAFWLLQGLGWLPIFLLLMALFGDNSVFTHNAIIFATSVTTVSIALSLLMQRHYRRLMIKKVSVLSWALRILLVSIAASVAVAQLHWVIWYCVDSVVNQYSIIYTAQPQITISLVLTVCYFIWSILYWSIRRQATVYKLQHDAEVNQLKMKEAQLNGLLQQLSPHFMFNTINNIRAMVLMDSEKARDMLMAFADLMRYQINPQSEARATVQEELDLVNAFVELHQLQLGNRLQYQQSIDDNCFDLVLPRMTVQLLVENAIKHSFCKQGISGVLSLTIEQLKTDRWQLCVCHPGQIEMVNEQDETAENSENIGIGLKNLQKRLLLFPQWHGDFSLQQQDDQVLATIIFTHLQDNRS